MKTVIITGASSGIGKAIAKTFSDKGWKTLLIARNQERLDQVASKLSGPSEVYSCDLTDPKAIEFLNEKFQKQPLHALVNNAGIYQPMSVDEDHDQPWIDHFESNLMSAVRLTRLVWPIFKKNKEGSIVNISSTLAIRPVANTGSYSASKAAMNNWTQTLAIEGAQYNIRANSVCPGLVDTPIHSFHQSQQPDLLEQKKMLQSIQPLGRMGQPKDIAPSVYHFCDLDSSWITGTLLNVDGGILLNS